MTSSHNRPPQVPTPRPAPAPSQPRNVTSGQRPPWAQAFDAMREFMGMTRVQAIQTLEIYLHQHRRLFQILRNTSGMKVIRRGDIQIHVRPLVLNIAQAALPSRLQQATTEKNKDDKVYDKLIAARNAQNPKKPKITTLLEWAKDVKYYGSRVHQAWAEAASARTSGQIPAEFWMKFDPFGGTAGTGPDVLPQGEWPGVLAAIAMGHDTDWSLGRYFGVGPMAALRDAPGSASDLGLVGLVPQRPNTRFSSVPLYSVGLVDDWVVKQVW